MAFPETHLSLVQALSAPEQSRREHAVDLLVRAYRQPLVIFIQQRWQLAEADAEDLVQDFFSAALQKEWLLRFDPERARFRTFLRLLAGRFAAKYIAAATRQKRGGSEVHLSLDDFSESVADEQSEGEARFRKEWIRSVFSLALEALRSEAIGQDRGVHLKLFEAYDLAEPPLDAPATYAGLGEEYQLTASQVINHLAWSRRRFRFHVLEVIRTLAGSEAEYRHDVRDLLGLEIP